MNNNQNLLNTILLLIAVLISGVSVAGVYDYSINSKLEDRSTLKDKVYFLDSLISKTPYESSVYFEALLLKFEILRKEKRDVQALTELKKVTENEKSALHPQLLGQAYLHTSDIYSQDKSYDLAQTYLTEAFIVFDGINANKEKAITLVKSATIYKKKKNYSSALRHYKQAHDIYLQQGKIIESLELAKEIGTTAYEGGEFKDAEFYLMTALNGFKQLSDTLEQTKILESLAGIYGFENRIEEKLLIEITLCDLSEASKNNKKTAKYLNQLANSYGANGQNRNALKTQEKALNFLSANNTEGRYEACIRLSELYMLNNRQTDAILTLHKANGIALSAEDATKIITSSKIIADFYKKRGEWQKAHQYLSISDSTSRALLETKIRKLENNPELQVRSDSFEQQDSLMSKSEYEWLFSAWRNTIIALSFSVLMILTLLIIYFRKRKKIRRILEWKVYKRTKELRDLNAELNTYIYKSSHDLRNPLTSIKSLITLLKNETNPDQLEKYTSLIESCANQMDEILLNLSRAVDYKKLEPKVEQIDFLEIKNKLDLSYLESLPEGIKLSWNIREKAPFFSDPNLIGVILKKTILNSIQYRHGSSTDFCKISITTDSSGAAVCIEDNGQGIAEKVKDSVFEMFVKGTHKSKGAGLGLYLVKIASDKLRGKILLESEENKGSKLIFELPNLT